VSIACCHYDLDMHIGSMQLLVGANKATNPSICCLCTKVKQVVVVQSTNKVLEGDVTRITIFLLIRKLHTNHQHV
jgi:hypothetical protein